MAITGSPVEAAVTVSFAFLWCVMRHSPSLLPVAACGLAAFALAAAIFLTPDFAAAEPVRSGTAPSNQAGACACPRNSDRPMRPKFAELKPQSDGRPLDAGDELAALQSVHVALSSVADGSTYVWHRNNGRLSGLVKPTSSFKTTEGTICRHIVVLLTSGERTRKTEGVACRKANGVWSLEG